MALTARWQAEKELIEQIEPAAAASLSRDVLRRQIEEIIHAIADKDRLELSGREQVQLAAEIADDMTGYGPLRPLPRSGRRRSAACVYRDGIRLFVQPKIAFSCGSVAPALAARVAASFLSP